MGQDITELRKRTGFDADQIFHSRNQWNQHPMKRILIAELEIEIEKLRTSLETCTTADLAGIQASIRTNRVTISKINAQQP